MSSNVYECGHWWWHSQSYTIRFHPYNLQQLFFLHQFIFLLPHLKCHISSHPRPPSMFLPEVSYIYYLALCYETIMFGPLFINYFVLVWPCPLIQYIHFCLVCWRVGKLGLESLFSLRYNLVFQPDIAYILYNMIK